jgi:hypothetical protein
VGEHLPLGERPGLASGRRRRPVGTISGSRRPSRQAARTFSSRQQRWSMYSRSLPAASRIVGPCAGEEGAGAPAPAALERAEVGVHVALRRVDDDRAQAGDHVAGDQRAPGLVEEAEVAGGVPGVWTTRSGNGGSPASTTRSPSTSSRRPARRGRRGARRWRRGRRRHPQPLAQRCDAADVVRVVVGQPDRDHPALATPLEGAGGGRQAVDLRRVVGAGVDEHAVAGPEQVGVGAVGRRQGAGGERQQQHPGAELDPPVRPEVGLRRVAQPGSPASGRPRRAPGAGGGSAARRSPRRARQRATASAGSHPLAGGALATVEAGLQRRPPRPLSRKKRLSKRSGANGGVSQRPA